MDEQTTYAPPAPPEPPSGTTTQAPPPAPPPGDGPSGRYTAGIVLIVIGALFLAGRFFPGFSWWNLWPLIIIVAGLVQAFTPGRDGWSVARMFDGFVTVAFGGVFLAITGGVVGWGVWARILEFWPVLLISIGLEILGKSLHASWPKVLGSLAVIAALAFSVVSYAGGSGWGGGWLPAGGGEPFSFAAPVGSTGEAKMVLDAGVARVALRPGRNLISVEGRTDYGRPSVNVRGSDETAEIAVNLGDADGASVWPGSRSPEFDVWLSDEVLWDLRLNTGVAELDADLSSIPVASVDLRPGVASCDVKLGEVPDGEDDARAEVRAGVSSVRISLPEDAEARVEISSGLSGHSVGGDFEDVGSGAWETPGFEAARDSGAGVWIISVRSGIGSIEIDTY